MIKNIVVKRHAQDAVNALANATEAMETLLDLSIEDASPLTLRKLETVVNLAELTGTLKARLQAKLARQGYVLNPLVPLKDRLGGGE